MDGRQRADFDAIDLFIADHSLDLEAAPEAMSTD
jgi:propanediol dehydratase large subunit